MRASLKRHNNLWLAVPAGLPTPLSLHRQYVDRHTNVDEMNAVRHETESTTAAQFAEAAKSISWLLPHALNTMVERPEVGVALEKWVRVKDLMTKYFYRDEHLCFQLLVLADGGEKVFFKEFTDYSECKRALDDLQKLKAQGASVRVPEWKSFLELAA